MKKILSIALCLMLMLVMGTLVFAADNEGDEVVVGENEIIVHLNEPGPMGHKFVQFYVEATGNYTFTCTSEDGMLFVGDPTDFSIPWLEKGESYTVYLVEGQIVDIDVYSPHRNEYDYGVTFTVTTDAEIDRYKDWTRLTLGENDIDVDDFHAFDGLECVYVAEHTGIYRITSNDENAYLQVDGATLEGAGVSHEVSVLQGSGLEILVGTYDMGPDQISFTIEAVSVAKTELELGTNSIYVPQERAQYGLDCTYVAETSGIYLFTAVSDNALVAIGGGNWMRVGESVEVTAGAGETIRLKVGDVEAEEASVVVSIELKQEVLEHQYVATVTPPSCSYEGYTTYKCSICGDSYRDDVVPATGEHVYQETENVPATCTEDGKIVNACMCGEAQVTVLPMTGHAHGEPVKENVVTGDCTTDASYDLVVKCENCSEEMSRETVTETAPGHKAAAAVKENEIAATCANDGSYELVVKCENCGVEISRTTEVVKATGEHVYATETERKAATCTEDGYVVMSCGCGATEQTVLPKTGHAPADAVKENDVAPTCTVDGAYEMVVYCATCNAEISRDRTVVPATGHDNAEAVKENDVAPTCTEDGSYEMVVYCKTCKAEVSREKTVVPATGHDNAEAVKENEKANSCTEDGSYEMVVYCKTCNAEVSREKTVVTATGHKNAEAVHENEIYATCGSDGSYDLVVYCEYCNAELSRTHETVKSTGEHVYAQETDRKDPTCTEDGYVTKACGCGAAETYTLTATGHKAAEAVKENEVAPTCTVDGSYESVVNCSVCATEMSRETVAVPATGHVAAEAVKENEVAPTCTTDGSYDMVVYCSVCAEEMSRETTTVPSTGEHVYATETERKEATCTEAGYVVMACGCGDSQTTELPMVEHTAAEAVKENEVAATCTTAGSYEMVVYCAACSAELERTTGTIEATGHTFGEWTVEKEATATEDGMKKRVCACGEAETEVIPALGEPETEPTEPETKPTEPAETKPAETKPAETKPAETKPATDPNEPAGEKEGNNVVTIVIIAVAVVGVGGGAAALTIFKKKK